MKVKPTRDNILVEPLKEKEVMGVLIPDTAGEKPRKGRVVAVGPGRITDDGTLIPVRVSEGDIVIYRKYAGYEIEEDEKEYLIISEEDVLAIVEE